MVVGGCRYAGMSTERSMFAPRISKEEKQILDRSGANYFCTLLKRPVYSDQGKTCPSWVDDD